MDSNSREDKAQQSRLSVGLMDTKLGLVREQTPTRTTNLCKRMENIHRYLMLCMLALIVVF